MSGARHVSGAGHRLLTLGQLRAHGVTPSTAAARCRPGGPWQLLLPGVVLLHPGPASDEERLHAALLYTRVRGPARTPAADPGGTPGGPGTAMITGSAALALHRFPVTPPLPPTNRVDVLVDLTRRLRSTGFVRVVRGRCLPRPQEVSGVPTAPVPRALADVVGDLPGAAPVRRLLLEAVRGGHCEAAEIVRELDRCRLLSRPYVADAAAAVLDEGRALAEGRLYAVVRGHRLPEPLWNVTLRLPGGPLLGRVDAYWPEQAVAVELDTRPAVRSAGLPSPPDDPPGGRDRLERHGITVVRVGPERLRRSPADQAAVIRTALMAAADLLIDAAPGDPPPGARVEVLPR
ncbi:hypothetical protein IHE55_08645 [Streptomyces pactum]|uniref:DUF559 domain-containing protein n=1 Tax=Streptomyces pactum TaxID=68249 RepID=A0ABS0NI41_9ACTN|nr:hypothetical protein [Streptomyces pactum]